MMNTSTETLNREQILSTLNLEDITVVSWNVQNQAFKYLLLHFMWDEQMCFINPKGEVK